MKKKQRREIMQLKITSQKFCKMQEVSSNGGHYGTDQSESRI